MVLSEYWIILALYSCVTVNHVMPSQILGLGFDESMPLPIVADPVHSAAPLVSGVSLA